MLFYLILLAFVIRTLRNGFYHTFLWQLKEYRFDRMMVHFKTDQGKKLFFGPLTLLKWIPLIILIGIITSSYLQPISEFYAVGISRISIVYYFFWSIWLMEAFLNVRELITRGWRAPNFTFRITLIVLATFILQFGVLSADKQAPLILGPLLDKLLAPTIAFFVILSNIPSLIFRKIIILLAKRKIARLPNLFVIGITGSFGKTSTKEFLATILKEKYEVVKTPESNNTEIGIAKYILKELKGNDEVFVVEMGAYRRGEINAICEMVSPKMGIITGINEQHIELFGSLENTKKAKYELIENLPKGAVAIFNGNNIYCRQMAKWAKDLKLKVLIYKIKTDVRDIKTFKDHLEFNYLIDKKKYNLKINLLGRQNIENILAAIYAANSMKMKISDIQKGLVTITSPEKTMKLCNNSLGLTLIDDSFNTNPTGVQSAIEYMKLYTGNKILVLSPIIELGIESGEIHQRLGKTVAPVADLILLTNPNFSISFKKGVDEWRNNTQKVQVVNSKQGIDLIKNTLDQDGVAVFEGKEAGKILKHLTE